MRSLAIGVVLLAGCYSTRFGTVAGERAMARDEVAQRARAAGLSPTTATSNADGTSDDTYVGPLLGPPGDRIVGSPELHYNVHVSPAPTGSVVEISADSTSDLSRLLPEGHTFSTAISRPDSSPLGRFAYELPVELGGVWGPRGSYLRADALLRLGRRQFLDSATNDPALTNRVGLAILGGGGVAVESTGRTLVRTDLTLSASFQQLAHVTHDRVVATSPLQASLTAAYLHSTSDSGRAVELQLAVPFPGVPVGTFVRAGYEWGGATVPRGFTVSTGYAAPPHAWAAIVVSTLVLGAAVYAYALACDNGCGPE